MNQPARLTPRPARLWFAPMLAAGMLYSLGCAAQVTAPAASAPQVPPPLRPVPSLTSPGDAQRSMDLDNEQTGGKVVPQVRIPLGKNAGPPVFERRRAAVPAASAPAALIDDAAARCESETDKQARASCRARLNKP